MVSQTLSIGAFGEREAMKWLRRNGYLIRDLNWRAGRYELDIVAERWDVIHFVEVKSRKIDGFTTPESAMTREKFNSIAKAARSYMAQFHLNNECQFDLMAVDILPDSSTQIRLFERVMEFRW